MKLNISAFIRQKRKELNLTQDELAEKLGVTKASVSKWEIAQSYPDLQLLPEIAEIFNCTVDELLGYRNPKTEYLEKEKRILREFTAETGCTRKLVLINIVSADPVRLSNFYRDILEAIVVNDREHGGPDRIELWFGKRYENAVCITVNYQKIIHGRKQQPAKALNLELLMRTLNTKECLIWVLKLNSRRRICPGDTDILTLKTLTATE